MRSAFERSNSWEVPYTFDHPEKIRIVNSSPPEGYNKLHESFALAKQVFKESQAEDSDEDECVPAPKLDQPTVNDVFEEEQDDDEELLTTTKKEKDKRQKMENFQKAGRWNDNLHSHSSSYQAAAATKTYCAM